MESHYKHLNAEERGVIFAEHERGLSLREIGLLLGRTLLRKSADGRFSPFPRRIYPTAFVTGMPRAV
jgi:hypothetical protein